MTGYVLCVGRPRINLQKFLIARRVLIRTEISNLFWRGNNESIKISVLIISLKIAGRIRGGSGTHLGFRRLLNRDRPAIKNWTESLNLF